jgi:hypothetical protein
MAFAVLSFFSRRNVLIILASIVFIVLCIFAYSYLRRLKDPVIPAFHAIPANAVMLAEIKKPDEFWKHLHTKNKIWSALLGSSAMNDFNTSVLFLDSLISQSKGLHEINEKKPLFIALCESKNNMNVLFLINTMGPHDEKLIGKFIHKNFSVSHRIAEQHYGGLNFTELKKDKSAVYVYVDQGICAISSDSACLRQSADALRNRSGLAFQKNFVQLQAIS